MSNAQPQLLSQMLAIAEGQTLALAEAIAPEIRLKPIAPGKAHTLWTLGHLAYALNNAGLRFTFAAPFVVPEDWIERFGPDFRGGRPPVEDPAAYPGWDAVLEGYRASVAALRAQIETLSDADLPLPLRGGYPGTPPPHFQTIGRALIHLISHDAYHRGQMGIIKAVG